MNKCQFPFEQEAMIVWTNLVLMQLAVFLLLQLHVLAFVSWSPLALVKVIMHPVRVENMGLLPPFFKMRPYMDNRWLYSWRENIFPNMARYYVKLEFHSCSGLLSSVMQVFVFNLWIKASLWRTHFCWDLPCFSSSEFLSLATAHACSS